MTGAVCGIALPTGLREADKLPQAIFTPSTKAPAGTHDENIAFSEAEKLLGPALAAQVRDKRARALHRSRRLRALLAAIIIARHEIRVWHRRGRQAVSDRRGADARFLALLAGRPVSRSGASPPSFDKQFVRDWLEAQGWDKKPPAPALPLDVLVMTAQKYRDALRLLVS